MTATFPEHGGERRMKAVVQDSYGPPDALGVRQVTVPALGDLDVLVRVKAAAVTRGAWHLITGMPYLVRLMGYGLRRPKVPVPGLEVAGTVERVGAGVTRFRAGDSVFGIGSGAFAEYCCVPEAKLALKPANLTFRQAAPMSISGIAALQAVRDEGRVKPGAHVLVIGASGSVGTFAVQIAKACHARVTAVCSGAKGALVRSLGADHVIDYTTGPIERSDTRYDVILDLAGNRPLSTLRKMLATQGSLVLVGGEQGGRWLGGIQRQLAALVLSPFVGQRLRPLVTAERVADLQALKAMAEAGEVRPVIDRTYPLEAAAAALHYLQAGRARGQIVLTV